MMNVDIDGYSVIVADIRIYINGKIFFSIVIMLAALGIGYYLAKKNPNDLIKMVGYKKRNFTKISESMCCYRLQQTW